MLKKTHLLDAVSWAGLLFGLSLADFESIVYIVLGIVSLIITLISGMISIIMKIKSALSDGKLTDEEIKDITKSLGDLSDDLKQGMEDLDKHEREHQEH